MKATHKIYKLTEEGKAMISWQFDETDIDNVVSVVNLKTREIIFAVRVPLDKSNIIKAKPKTIYTVRYIWKLWHDGYNWLITRVGENI